jgi:uncharacterized protein YggE
MKEAIPGKLNLREALLFIAVIFGSALNGPSARALRMDAAASEHQVRVTGECTSESEPDRGSVVLVAEHQAPDAKTAIRRATELHEKVKAELKRAKVKNLELSSVEYTVQEVTAWENNRSVSKGYVCRIGMKAVTTEIGSLGEILAIAGEVGIRNTSALQTYLSDSKMMEEKKKCLEGAAKNAHDKAQHLAKSLGARLGPVIYIEERGAQPSMPRPMMRESFAMKASAPEATIEAAKQEVRMEIEAAFSLEP